MSNPTQEAAAPHKFPHFANRSMIEGSEKQASAKELEQVEAIVARY